MCFRKRVIGLFIFAFALGMFTALLFTKGVVIFAIVFLLLGIWLLFM